MSDLSEFLLARIAEDEAVARDALHPDATQPGAWITEHHNSEHHSEPNRAHIAEDRKGHYWSVAHEVYIPVAEHVARHDPARVLAECEAKRRIVEQAVMYADESFPNWDGGYASGMEAAVEYLAAIYSDHPDYRQEWRP